MLRTYQLLTEQHGQPLVILVPPPLLLLQLLLLSQQPLNEVLAGSPLLLIEGPLLLRQLTMTSQRHSHKPPVGAEKSHQSRTTHSGNLLLVLLPQRSGFTQPGETRRDYTHTHTHTRTRSSGVSLETPAFFFCIFHQSRCAGCFVPSRLSSVPPSCPLRRRWQCRGNCSWTCFHSCWLTMVLFRLFCRAHVETRFLHSGQHRVALSTDSRKQPCNTRRLIQSAAEPEHRRTELGRGRHRTGSVCVLPCRRCVCRAE